MPFALALTVVLAALAVFQLALVFGAPLGRFAWVVRTASCLPACASAARCRSSSTR